MSLRFNLLLREAGLDPAEVRLLRHQPVVEGRPLADVWRADRPLFEAYQQLQATAQRASFARPYWASFVGTWDGRTMFAGLYAVGAPEIVEQGFTAPISGRQHGPGEYDRYLTEWLPLLEKYEGRLFVEWGGGASGKRAWSQRADNQDKRITELHLEGQETAFPGLLQMTTSLSALDAAPPSWIQALSDARGVYLLTCPRDGSLYVGSAMGVGGFWQRWAEYRANGHGGNIALIGREPSDFTVSILEVAGSTATSDDVLRAETLWKRKLATRAHGLNRNG